MTSWKTFEVPEFKKKKKKKKQVRQQHLAHEVKLSASAVVNV
jgi:hypothetical protein